MFAHSPITIMEQTTERSSYNSMSLGFSRYLRLASSLLLLLHRVDEVRAHHAVHHAVVAAQRQRNHALHDELAVVLYAPSTAPRPLSSGTTTFCRPPMARMHDCGGLMMAEKLGMPYMPRLLTVMLPDYAVTPLPLLRRTPRGAACPPCSWR